MANDVVLHYVASLMYLISGMLLLRDKHNLILQTLLLATAVVHGVAVHFDMFTPSAHGLKTITINWSLSISFMMWLGVLFYLFESTFLKIKGYLYLIIPAAVVSCALAATFPPSEHSIGIPIISNIFLMHMVFSFFAYAIIALAAIHVVIMFTLEKYLRRPINLSEETSIFSRIINAQPPLMVQERMLYRVIWVGFLLLTISIISGAIVSMDLNGVLLPRDHKTFFTLFSWIIFGVLLFGRSIWGWRGRSYLRWTLIGFGLLFLAYTGTRFILEVLLHRV
ncbi:cytochrome C assembly family protein [Taylorella equigenitalis]|uniref:cytochrome C assembly family protein n=1 Tax=Taylorella equigenitalis TaxID=29575 RepID=UPI000404D68F|nr:cytochrome c biogenesis protein CcsA [Taylorella equigenitalis]WDU46673.1 cytochrome c biogenesis protein CcsA [Taylorella equigenitalis]